MKQETISAIKENKIIAIVRGAGREDCIKLTAALYEGGIRLIEFTYNQNEPASWSETAGIIETLKEEYGEKMKIGAGTVTSEKLVRLTAEHKGEFIVAPNTNPAVIKTAGELGLVSVPGAMTPTEILTAWDSGADFVKLFPASCLGLGYFKAIRAPINHVPLIATEGINEKNARPFLEAGAAAVGVGGMLANGRLMAEGRYDEITAAAKLLVESIR